MNTNGEGWIYLIESENGLHKIGYTANLKHRLLSLSAQSSVVVRYIHYFKSKHMATSEKWLHNKYKDYRHHGEWFQAMNRRAMNRQLVYIVILAALSFGGWLYLRWDFIVAVMQDILR
jgi:hypothetical protein